MNYKLTFNKQKRACDLAIITGLILLYFILNAIKVSPPRYVIKHEYKEIDWTLFNSNMTRNVSNEGSASSPKSKNKNSSDLENIIVANLDFLESEANNGINLTKKAYGALKVPTTGDVSNNKIDVVSTEHVSRLPSLAYHNKNSNFRERNFPTSHRMEGPSIEIDNSENLNVNISSKRYNNSRKLHEIPREDAILTTKVIKIDLKPEEIKKQGNDISPIVSELIKWMKKYPTTFPDVFKRFMKYEAGNLTSKVKFEINNKVYELYILCKESILEVKICLIEVEKDRSILLIDSGFKERSNYLREGDVIRSSQNGQISSFITSQKTPSAKVTTEFYQIFLSWWGTVKKDFKNGVN